MEFYVFMRSVPFIREAWLWKCVRADYERVKARHKGVFIYPRLKPQPASKLRRKIRVDFPAICFLYFVCEDMRQRIVISGYFSVVCLVCYVCDRPCWRDYYVCRSGYVDVCDYVLDDVCPLYFVELVLEVCRMAVAHPYVACLVTREELHGWIIPPHLVVWIDRF